MASGLVEHTLLTVHLAFLVVLKFCARLHKPLQVTKSVGAAEAAAQAEAEAKKRNKAGLDSVLASLQAAKKVNVLDKSRSDWKDYKTSDTKVSAEGCLAASMLRLICCCTSELRETTFAECIISQQGLQSRA